MLSYFDSQLKRQNKDYFIELLNIARVDGTISDSELKLLGRIGKRLGLTDEEIHFLMSKDESTSYHPPMELSGKFFQFYEIIKLTLADGVFSDEEKRMARIFAAAAGFNEKEIVLLLEIVYNGINSNRDEDELLEEFRRRRMDL